MSCALRMAAQRNAGCFTSGVPELKNPSLKSERTRAALLAAGARLLEAEGPDAATSTAIAAEAGVAVGTFYRYFEDRGALLAALFAAALDDVITAVAAALSPARLLDRGIDGCATAVVDVVARGYRRHHAAIRAALAALPSDARLRDVYRTRHDRAVADLVTFLRRAAAANLASATSPRPRAVAAVVLIQSLNHPAALAQGRSGTAVRRQVARGLATVLREA